MVARDEQQAYGEIVTHICKQTGAYSDWYCGIASDPEDRLFHEHKVPRKDYWWVFRQCHNNNDARAVETKLIELGCDGAPGGGDESTVYVYAYLKSANTNP